MGDCGRIVTFNNITNGCYGYRQSLSKIHSNHFKKLSNLQQMAEKLCTEFDNEISSVWRKISSVGKKSYLRVPINAMIALPSITPAYQEEINIDHKIHTASFILRANICVRGTGQVREQASRRIS